MEIWRLCDKHSTAKGKGIKIRNIWSYDKLLTDRIKLCCQPDMIRRRIGGSAECNTLSSWVFCWFDSSFGQPTNPTGNLTANGFVCLCSCILNAWRKIMNASAKHEFIKIIFLNGSFFWMVAFKKISISPAKLKGKNYECMFWMHIYAFKKSIL